MGIIQYHQDYTEARILYFISGFLCMRYGELLLKGEAKDLYQGILSQPNQPLKLKLQVGNFCTYVMH